MPFLPNSYSLPSGELSSGEFASFQQRVKDTGMNVDWSATVDLEPGGWAVIGENTYQNDTGSTQTYETNGSMGSDETDLNIQFGNTDVDATEVGVVQFENVEINNSIFDEPFNTLVSLDMGDAYIFDPVPQPSGMVETDAYKWDLSIMGGYNENTVIDVDGVFSFALSNDVGWVGRGFHLNPRIDDLSPGHTELILMTNSSFVDSESWADDDPEWGFWDIYTGYYGIWVIGNTGSGGGCLWVDLTGGGIPDASGFAGYGSRLPLEDPTGGTEYQYILVGSGEHSIDLNQYDSYLAGDIMDVRIETWLEPMGG